MQSQFQIYQDPQIPDWDQDGLADTLDEVNADSEAKFNTSSSDRISFPDGVDRWGIVLLVEPSHREAFLIVAVPGTLTSASNLTGASFALDLVESVAGAEARAAFLQVFNADIIIHLVQLPPLVGANITLAWTRGAIPADGTWLLINTHPTMRIELALCEEHFELGGQSVHKAPRSLSHLVGDGALEFRWQFMNLHSGAYICYDPLWYTQLDPCQGAKSQGWLRAYSGQAARALKNTYTGLQNGQFPLVTLGLPVIDDLAANDYEAWATRWNATWILAQQPSLDKINPFDADSAWKTLGTSATWRTGLGLDFFLQPDDAEWEQATVRALGEIPSLPVPDPSRLSGTPVDLRPFIFEGSFFNTTGSPRDIRQVVFNLRPLDGNPAPQAFLLDGKRLNQLLDVRPGEQLVATIDEEHSEGFLQQSADLNGDGVLDLLISIPHFSWASVTVTNSNETTAVDFWQVKMTDADHAWLTGARGAVYRYEPYGDGHRVRRVSVSQAGQPAPRGPTMGIHIISDTNFWVAGASGLYGMFTNGHYQCQSGDNGYWAHYDNGTWSIQWAPSCNHDVYAVWFSSTGSSGYVGGDGAFMAEYSGTSWTTSTAEYVKTITDINLNDELLGYISSAEGIVAFDGACTSSCSRFTRVTSPYEYHQVLDLDDASASFATGKLKAYNQTTEQWQEGAGILARDESAFQQVVHPELNGADFFRVSAVPGSPGTYWFTGVSRTKSCYDGESCGIIARKNGEEWRNRVLPAQRYATGISFANDNAGLVAGDAFILQWRPNKLPIPLPFLPSTATTLTPITGTAGTSSDPDGDTIIQYGWEWGDETHSTGSPTNGSASHRYDDVGTMTVKFWLEDDLNGRNSTTRTVEVTPTFLTYNSTTPTRTFTATGEPQRHQYLANATTTARFARARLVEFYTNGTPVPSTDRKLVLAARNDTQFDPKSADGNWPSVAYSNRFDLIDDLAANTSLWVQVYNPDGVARKYALTFEQAAQPAKPTIQPLDYPATGRDPVTINFTVSHPEGRLVKLRVSWDANQASEETLFLLSGSTVTLNHTYPQAASPTTYTIRAWGVDETNRAGPVETLNLPVVLTPSGEMFPPPGEINATTVSITLTLQGNVTNYGGASAVYARFVAEATTRSCPKNETTPVPVTGTAPTAFSSTIGLRSGCVYRVNMILNNTASSYWQGPNPGYEVKVRSNQAPTPVMILTTARNQDLSTNVYGFNVTTNDPAPPAQYSFMLDWGDGSTTWSGVLNNGTLWQPTHPYAYAGPYVPTVVSKATVGGWSLPETMEGTDKTVNVGETGNKIGAYMANQIGDWKLHAYTYPTSVGFRLTIPENAFRFPEDNVYRFKLLDQRTGKWTFSNPVLLPSITSQTNIEPSPETRMNVVPGRLYGIGAEIRRGAGGEFTDTGPGIWGHLIQSNQPPRLWNPSIKESRISYLDKNRIEVTYADAPYNQYEMDEPAVGYPVVIVEDVAYPMHFLSGDWKAARFYVELPLETMAGSKVVSFFAYDKPQPGSPLAASGKSQSSGTLIASKRMYVTQSHVVWNNFDGEVRRLPWGFSTGDEPSAYNYWRVIDAGSSLFSSVPKLAEGAHSEVLWFGRNDTGNYQTDDGATPKGSVLTGAYNLSRLSKPTLSFSSFFETEGPGERSARGNEWRNYDRKMVQMRCKATESSPYGAWQTLRNLTETSDGNGGWHTLSFRIGACANKFAQFRFTFDAIDTQFNLHLGWFLDDVVVGNDQDDDGLPDQMERTRNDVLVTTNHAPDRASASSITTTAHDLSRIGDTKRGLLATIHNTASSSGSPVPTIRVEADVALGRSESQVAVTGCQSLAIPGIVDDAPGEAWDPGGNATGALTRVSEGGTPPRWTLYVRVDLKSCFPPDAFDGIRAWSLVTPRLTGFEWVDGFQVLSSGTSDPRNPDSDGDGTDDRTELNAFTDLLSVDADGDGIPESLDDDDHYSNAVPIIRVGSDDWDKYADFTFLNQPKPVSVKFVGYEQRGTCKSVGWPCDRPSYREDSSFEERTARAEPRSGDWSSYRVSFPGDRCPGDGMCPPYFGYGIGLEWDDGVYNGTVKILRDVAWTPRNISGWEQRKYLLEGQDEVDAYGWSFSGWNQNTPSQPIAFVDSTGVSPDAGEVVAGSLVKAGMATFIQVGVCVLFVVPTAGASCVPAVRNVAIGVGVGILFGQGSTSTTEIQLRYAYFDKFRDHFTGKNQLAFEPILNDHLSGHNATGVVTSRAYLRIRNDTVAAESGLDRPQIQWVLAHARDAASSLGGFARLYYDPATQSNPDRPESSFPYVIALDAHGGWVDRIVKFPLPTSGRTWRWDDLSLPSGSGIPAGRVAQLELVAKEELLDGVARPHEQTYCLAACRSLSSTADAVLIKAYNGSLLLKQLGAVNLPLGYRSGVRNAYDIMDRQGKTTNQSVPDFVAGTLGLEQARLYVRQDPTAHTPADDRWYWGATNTSCPAAIRRCNHFNPTGHIAERDFGTDKLRSVQADWTGGTNLHDALTSKGVVAHSQDNQLESTEGVLDEYPEWMNETLGSQPFATKNADIRNAYDWTKDAPNLPEQRIFVLKP